MNPAPALAMEGVEAWVDHTSLKRERNKFAMAIVGDELLFAEKEVHCVGMIIGDGRVFCDVRLILFSRCYCCQGPEDCPESSDKRPGTWTA